MLKCSNKQRATGVSLVSLIIHPSISEDTFTSHMHCLKCDEFLGLVAFPINSSSGRWEEHSRNKTFGASQLYVDIQLHILEVSGPLHRHHLWTGVHSGPGLTVSVMHVMGKWLSDSILYVEKISSLLCQYPRDCLVSPKTNGRAILPTLHAQPNTRFTDSRPFSRQTNLFPTHKFLVFNNCRADHITFFWLWPIPWVPTYMDRPDNVILVPNKYTRLQWHEACHRWYGKFRWPMTGIGVLLF